MGQRWSAGNILEPMADGRSRYGWYLTRGWYSLITVPLFLLLAVTLITEIRDDIIRLLALVAALKQLGFGMLGSMLIITSVGWWIALLPAILIFTLLTTLPTTWVRSDASTRTKLIVSIAIILLFFAVAYGIDSRHLPFLEVGSILTGPVREFDLAAIFTRYGDGPLCAILFAYGNAGFNVFASRSRAR